MSRHNNPTTTGRIAGVVYDLRHWKLTLLVGIPMVLTRFLVGRDLRGGRKTDATFLRKARMRPGGWWGSAPGWLRAVLRIGFVVGTVAWFAGYQGFVVTAGVVTFLMIAAVIVRRWCQHRYEKRVLYPVWPAVAGIIGVDERMPPSAWLDIPRDMSIPDAEIVIGLREADTKDEARVAALVRLFDQRFERRHIAKIDYGQRLVFLRLRPDEPAVWPAVAAALEVDDTELAAAWLTMPEDIDDPDARIRIRLPRDIIDDRTVVQNLKTLVGQRFGGEWDARSNRRAGHVTLTRKRPTPEPPKLVDWFDFEPETAGELAKRSEEVN